MHASAAKSTYVDRARSLVGRPFDPARLIGNWPAAELDAEGATLSRDRARLAARSWLRDLHADMVRRLSRAGVPLLAGTDAVPAYPLTVPGFTLHDELAALVGAGLTPAAALRAATFEPARYLAATDSLGTVATGKIADLIVLDADPLASIRNTTQISMVVANGRVIDAARRARLLAGVERRAGAAGRGDRR